MEPVATLTLNPAIDSACEAEAVFPTHKVRTHGERYDPGGGGINVARVLARLGHKVAAIYLAGGVTGAMLDELLALPGIERQRLAIHDHTRMSLAVFERSTGREYRFVPEGPLVNEAEWQAALDHAGRIESGWLIASGSLPRGVPADFYARLAQVLARRGVHLALDTSGDALAAAIAAGGLALVKPSQGEFEALIGTRFSGPEAIGEAALGLVRAGKTRRIAVTLGHLGAVLADADGVMIHPGLTVEVRSATGAGDSFTAGMVDALLRGEPNRQAFLRGIAAGTAAVLSPGTGLCEPAEIDAQFARLRGSAGS